MYSLVGAASGWGAQIIGTSKGPKYLRHHLDLTDFPCVWADCIETCIQSEWTDKASLVDTRFSAVIDVCTKLAQALDRAKKNNFFPVVLGGDHSIAAGSWRGVMKRVTEKDFGLLWVDAHMDAHTPQTSPSMAYHGMPVAALLGHGSEDFVSIYKTGYHLNPKRLVLYGIRSFEIGEQKLLERLGVRIFYCEEIDARGHEVCLAEAYEILTKDDLPFGVSLDLDVFDPSLAPGVGSPEKNGLDFSLIPALKPFFAHGKLQAFEIVEFNPERDIQGKTANLVDQLLKFFMRARSGYQDA